MNGCSLCVTLALAVIACTGAPSEAPRDDRRIRDADGTGEPSRPGTASTGDGGAPTAVPAAAPPKRPRPTDPGYDQYIAAQDIRQAERALQQATFELLKARALLSAPRNGTRYAKEVATLDERIRRLLPLWCAETIAAFKVDIATTPIEELFPLEHAGRATEISCNAFLLSSTTGVRGRAW